MSKPYAPPPDEDGGSNLYHVLWGGLPVPNPFAVVVTEKVFGDWLRFTGYVTDHPAAGPTGPPACGVCYDEQRPTRSFQWGKAVVPVCPGVPFHDEVCNAELIWEFGFNCPVSIDDSTWGRIKTLHK
jgi:hypothetical protein